MIEVTNGKHTVKVHAVDGKELSKQGYVLVSEYVQPEKKKPGRKPKVD